MSTITKRICPQCGSNMSLCEMAWPPKKRRYICEECNYRANGFLLNRRCDKFAQLIQKMNEQIGSDLIMTHLDPPVVGEFTYTDDTGARETIKIKPLNVASWEKFKETYKGK